MKLLGMHTTVTPSRKIAPNIRFGELRTYKVDNGFYTDENYTGLYINPNTTIKVETGDNDAGKDYWVIKNQVGTNDTGFPKGDDYACKANRIKAFCTKMSDK